MCAYLTGSLGAAEEERGVGALCPDARPQRCSQPAYRFPVREVVEPSEETEVETSRALLIEGPDGDSHPDRLGFRIEARRFRR